MHNCSCQTTAGLTLLVVALPNPDPDGTTDLSDEDHGRRTVSDDDLAEPATEPEPDAGPIEGPSRDQNGTEPEAEDEDAPSVDMDEYRTLEEACAALVEQMDNGSKHPEENEHTDSDTDAERQEATI